MVKVALAQTDGAESPKAQKTAPLKKKRRWGMKLFVLSLMLLAGVAEAQGIPAFNAVNEGSQGTRYTLSMEIVALMTLLTLLPSLLLMMTPFVRIIIVMSLLRQALGTGQTPPNMVLVGLAGIIADIHWRWTFLLYLLGWLLLLPVALTLTEPRREPAPEPLLAAQAHAARRSHFLLVIGSAYLLSGFASLCFYMVASQLPFLVRESGTHSGLLLGLAVGMVQLAAALGSAWFARLKRRCSYLAVFAVAYALMGVGLAAIGFMARRKAR